MGWEAAAYFGNPELHVPVYWLGKEFKLGHGRGKEAGQPEKQATENESQPEGNGF